MDVKTGERDPCAAFRSSLGSLLQKSFKPGPSSLTPSLPWSISSFSTKVTTKMATKAAQAGFLQQGRATVLFVNSRPARPEGTAANSPTLRRWVDSGGSNSST